MISRLILGFIFVLSMNAFGAMGEEGKTFEAHFLDKMIMHHKDGVKMAEMGKQKATDEKLKKMSEKMLSEQKREITQMEKWRKDLYTNVPMSKEMPPKMDMSKLQEAKGKDFDKQYLSMMSEHHRTGIDMFQEAEKKATNPQIKEFAMKGSEKQAQEEKEMKDMKDIKKGSM